MAIKLQIKIFKDSFFYSRGLCGTLFTILGFSHILFVLYMGGGCIIVLVVGPQES